jgi:hypothetical protein
VELRHWISHATVDVSIMALSKQSPTEPIDGTSSESVARWVNANEVYCDQDAGWVPGVQSRPLE